MPVIEILIGLTALLGGAVVIGAVVIAYLRWDDLLAWFRSRSRIKDGHRDRIAFTIKEAMKSGRYLVVQGIFDTQTEKVLESETYDAEEVDDLIAERHVLSELVLYE